MMKRLFLSLAATLVVASPAWAATRVLVLPFVVPPDASATVASLGAGTMDSLIAALSRLPAFIVVDRATTQQVLKEHAFYASGIVDAQSASRIGRIVGASAIITGRIQPVGDQVRVTATFIDGGTSQIRRVEQVTGSLANAFGLQSQIASRFLTQQGITPSEETERQTNQVFKATASLSAYEAYQKGRDAYLRFTEAGFTEALNWFQRAIDADPTYALAYAAKAECHVQQGDQRQASRQPYAACFEQAHQAAGTALDLDSRLPEANRAMSAVLQQKQDTTSQLYAERALDGAPNDAETLVALWASRGSHPDAPEIKQAITNTPRLLLAHTLRGIVLLEVGRLDEAISEFQFVNGIDAGSPLVHTALANALSGKGRLDDAVAEYRTAIHLQPGIPFYHDNLGSTLQAKGLQDEAIAEYRISIGLNDTVARPHYNIACAYALKGDADKALQHLGRAIVLNPPYRDKAPSDADFASLRSDDRFIALVGTAAPHP